ncbi:hypothetical protein [Pontimicrobium aquaticum]|uniref:Beta-carotene 15,15'-monooxygenase n=1 Tax=Pontimicrobium aquaticum TaxID=2565367 RepID=A0A4U0F2U6_9FLAO|nr:hypothetical protein [Pontimicrobium aquaticum]TJY37032.1 hypothetical protein E5167_03555 [Pontimicrobium aquaticum]
MNYLEILSKIQNAQHLDFGRILDSSINMFKEVWLKGFLMVIVLAVFIGVLSFLFTTIGLSPDPYSMTWYEDFNFYSYYTSNALYSLPQAIIISSVSIGLLAGFYRIVKQVDLNELQKDDLFYYFSEGYISKIFMLGIMYALIATIAQLLFFIPYIYVFVPLSFFAVVFSNNPELTETEIVKLSFNIGTKKWLITFGLIFITGILGMLGMIACFVGVLFTMSIYFLPVYFVYRDVVGFEDDSEIMKIGTE